MEEAEDLAHTPSGTPAQGLWLGLGMALIPFSYGVEGLLSGHTRFIGRGSRLDVYGPAAMSLSIAYIALGVFVHAHWFWGLHPRLHTYSGLLKLMALLVFLGGFGFAIVKVLV